MTVSCMNQCEASQLVYIKIIVELVTFKYVFLSLALFYIRSSVSEWGVIWKAGKNVPRIYANSEIFYVFWLKWNMNVQVGI